MSHDTMFQTVRQGFALWPLCASAVLACALLAGTASAQSTAEQGFRIMSSGPMGNCVACHTVPGQTGVASTFGPALSQVGARYSADELRQWVTDARLIKPDTLMPPFGTTTGTKEPIRAQSILSFDEIGHVVAALQTLR
jgi:L-cysteine S-thiosulfotransferase